MSEPTEPAPTGNASATPVESGPEEPSNPFEALRTRTLVPFAILGGLFLLAVVYLLFLATPLDPDDPATGDVAFMLSLYGALLGWIVWVCRNSGISLRRLVGRLPSGHDWLTALGLLAVTMIFSIGSWEIFAYCLALAAPGVLEFLIEAVESTPDPTLAYLVAMTAVTVVFAPVIEEVLFRGILLNRWATKWSVPTAVVATSVAFGFLHAHPVGITVVGLVAAILYLKTGSLLIPIAFHVANNLVATILEFMAGPMEPLDVAAEIQEIRDAGLSGVGIVLVTLPILIWYLRRHWPEREAGIPYGAPTEIAENP